MPEIHSEEYLFTYHLRLARFEVVGPTPEGLLALAFPEGGEVTGPALSGRILSYGGDRLLLRRDGVAVPDVRLAVETGDGALVHLAFQGVMDAGVDGYDRFLNQTLPPVLPSRGVVQVRAAAEPYAWFNRAYCHGVARVDLEKLTVTNDVYTIR